MTSSMRSLEVTTLSNTHAKDHGKTTLDDGSVRRRDLYLKSVTFTRDIHYCTNSGIRTRNSSRRETPDPSLDRPTD